MGLDRVDTQDVFVPSDAGLDELKGGATSLPAAAIELLVLFDGKASLGEVSGRVPSLTYEAARALAQKLATDGYLELARPEPDVSIDFSYFFGNPPPPPPVAGALLEAGKEADGGLTALSLDGYYVSIARRAAEKRKPAAGGASKNYSVLAVEDDPELQRALKFLLMSEGFEPRVAGNREEIVAALRQLPSPDMILLDVMLPDTNGFDILAKLHSHPALKEVPVIMLTGKATREDVMRGLAGGAAGYITKPFDPEILIRGVRAVLGLA